MVPMNGTNGHTNNRDVYVWSDGCYDMVHFGHANSLRQAKEFGTHLIVGVHTDADIARHKGPPVFNQEERCRMVNAVRWVDEVVEGAPYVTSVETLDSYGADFCVHGNDITTTSDGTDTYYIVKSAGRYRECIRTQGISTTDLVGRMLLMSKVHQIRPNQCSPSSRAQISDLQTTYIENLRRHFSRYLRPRTPTDRVAYVGGSFDMFHVGHLDLLEKAVLRSRATYLIVGLHSDGEINERLGVNYPIMNVEERELNVMAYSVVNEVIAGAPFNITDEFIDEHKIDVVCRPESDDYGQPDAKAYAIPSRRNMISDITGHSKLTTAALVNRILDRRQDYERRNRLKTQQIV